MSLCITHPWEWLCARSTAVKFGIPFGPVLKHGPRSLSSMRVNEYMKLICVKNLTVQWDYELCFTVQLLHPGVFSSTYAAMYMENIPWAYWIWPERWWTMPDQVEARGNPGGGPKQFWRANRLSELGIGAKDQSNHLVAGSFRSFPQDSWSIEISFSNSYLVKRMIRGLRNEMFLTYSQTLNGYVS